MDPDSDRGHGLKNINMKIGRKIIRVLNGQVA